MSNILQPNGTPCRSLLPRRKGLSRGEEGILQAAKDEAHEVCMVAVREARRALGAGEIGREEFHRRFGAAQSAKLRAGRVTHLAILTARRMPMAHAA